MSKNSNSKNFNAYKYAREFEKLSLEVVNIIFKETLSEKEIIHKDLTKETRDKGVDAYLVLNVKNTSIKCTYTIEAKLRTNNTLSLKDFATSILYYLINTSVRHYVVTNITYSKEAIKYIEQFNSNEEKCIELVDGRLLQNIINTHLTELYKNYDYSNELINYIVSESFPKDDFILKNSIKPIRPSFENLMKITVYEQKIENIKVAITEGYCNFIVLGNRGTGKSSLLKMVMQDMNYEYSIYKFDISIIQTPKLFLIEILRVLLKIDIDALFSDLASNNDTINKIFQQFQSYDSIPMELLKSIKILINNDCTSENSVYLFDILMQHLYNNFLIHKKIIIKIENLHEANEVMIKFIIDISRIICNNNILLFWELLLPINSQELLCVSSEQWFHYLNIVKRLIYGDKPSHCISMKQFTKNDIVEIFANYLPEITLTEEYINTFINIFGLIPQNVFSYIKTIKSQGIFSCLALNQFANKISFSNEYYIKDLYRNADCRFYKEAFTYTMLLTGKLKYSILEYLDETYKICSQEELMKTGLYTEGNEEIVFKYQYLSILNETVDMVSKKHCATILLEHIEQLQFNHIDKAYYKTLFQYIVSPDSGIGEINNIIESLSLQKIYRYVIPLAEIRYKYYESHQDLLLYYKYYIAYIEYAQKSNMFDEKSFSLLLNKADLLQKDLMFKSIENKKFIKINIQYAFIKYQWNKLNYNYRECEKNIEYILNFEDMLDCKYIFAQARIYYALIKKERGLRKEFIAELVNNLHKYPNNKDVKVSYYVNIAAMYKHDIKKHGIDTAIKLLKTAREITYCCEENHGDLEVEIGLLNLLCFSNRIKYEQIQFIRLMAEKCNSMQYLAKTFNLEAYYHLKNKDFDKTINCLKAAIYHSLSSGQSKQYFLFGLNLLTVIGNTDFEKKEEFFKVFLTYGSGLRITKKKY